MAKLLLTILIKYIEKHPDQIVDLFGELTRMGITSLRNHNAAP